MTPYEKAFREGQNSVLRPLMAAAEDPTLHVRTRRTIRALVDVFDAEISRKQSLSGPHLAASLQEALSTRREAPRGSSVVPRG